MTMDSGKVEPGPQQASSQHKQHSDILWQPRNVSPKQSVAQYSRFVGRMKIALPAVAGVILLLVLLLPQFRADSERFRVGVKNLTDITNDTLSMINARYVGEDDQGHPYTLTAASARERSGEDKAIDLVSPEAHLTDGAGKSVKITATNGVYDRNQQILDLAGQVDVVQQEGYEVHSTAARILIKERIATGDKPVTGKGSFGTIDAAGFSVRDNGSSVNFTGPVKLVLDNDHDKAAPETPAPAAPAPAGGEQKK
jgi:lipopolysaccharide export system protein LptC